MEDELKQFFTHLELKVLELIEEAIEEWKNNKS